MTLTKPGQVPPNIGNVSEDGINNAYEALVHDEQSAHDLARLLSSNPRETIRRAITMNKYQRAAFMEMTDAEVRDLVKPVIAALGSKDPTGVRLELSERLVTESPFRIRCYIDYQS